MSGWEKCCGISLLWLVSVSQIVAAPTDAMTDAQVTDLSIEELVKLNVPKASKKAQIKKKLLNVKVSSVSKSAQALSNAAAAVYVIDNEMIKRSGATSIPEVLRLAPGIDVARINNSKWAVTARGFNGRFANKLLVLVDGRNIYTQDFSGVYWDTQEVMLEDIERIEIIRGPGATLWGANATNGVVNIITKHTEDTQGGLLIAGGGSRELGFGALRYGTQLDTDTFARGYIKGFGRDQFITQHAEDDIACDTWQQIQGGFRLDSSLSTQDNWMLQGNVYQGKPEQDLKTRYLEAFHDPVKTAGWNMTSRFNHTFSSTADYSLQLYYDYYQRYEYMATVHRTTLDIDFQSTFSLGGQHSVIWGLGYRYTDDIFENGWVKLIPDSRNAQLFSAFVQDEVNLQDNLVLTVGSKFEHNDYTGFEIQPSVRVLWTPMNGHKVWAAISRAVRTPARTEANAHFAMLEYPPLQEKNPLPLPIQVMAEGSSTFRSEQALSYELGYRWMFNNNISWDIAAFYTSYDTLRTTTYGNVVFRNNQLELPVTFNNSSYGDTQGFEISGIWQILDWWRWDLNYSLLKTHLYGVTQYQAAISPEQTIALRAALNPIEKVAVDIAWRYVDSAKALNPLDNHVFTIPAYTTLDARIAWQPVAGVELSITGQNLLQTSHLEYIDEAYALPAGVPRGIYGKMSWQF